MRPNGEIYECLAVYVDDLGFVMKDLQAFVDALEKKHKFKLKGTGPLEFHLGADFFRNDEGVLCMAPKKCIERMIRPMS